MKKNNVITETDFVNLIVKEFEKYFIVKKECRSKCGTKRIDLVLQIPNSEIFFGIEAKRPDKKRGEKIAKYILQAMSYSSLEFDVFKNGSKFIKIPIFICPALSYNYFILNEYEKELNVKSNLFQHFQNDNSHLLHHQDRHTKYNKHHTFNGVLGGFNIGEVRRNFDRSFYFSFSNKVIYTTEKNWQTQNIKGLHLENYKKLNEISVL
jgi:hypothetical protein